jgi:hypothetical protein
MLDKFKYWYTKNYSSITWFLIGFLTMGGLVDFSRGETVNALILFGIALVNYAFVKKS